MSRILIVDDEKSIRVTLAEFLRADGYEVFEAEDADAALQRLNEWEFDVVVTDIILPRVTGVELLRRIHASAPHVQVVMMTGEPTVETASESLRAGAADYLFKPITKAGILRVVANAVRLKSLEDTRRRLEAENRAHRENLERLVEERTAGLRESETRFQQIAEHMGEWVWEVDATGLYTYASPVVEKILGYRPDELVGKRRFYDLFAADQREPLKQAAFGHFDSKLPFVRFRNHCVHREGRLVLLETSGTPLLDVQGRLLGYRGVDSDITVRERVEEALRETMSVLKQVLDTIPQAIFWKDTSGAYLGCNQVFARAAGLADPDRIVGLTDFDLPWPREDAEAYRADDAHVIATGTPKRHIVEPLRQSDGTRLWIDTTKLPMWDPQRDVWGVLGVYEDITERRKAEAQLRKLVRAVEQSPVSIVITDRAGSIEFVNPKFTQVTGYTLADVLGQNTRILGAGETSAEDYKRLWETILAGKEWRGEFHNKRKDGSLYWEAASISAIRDASGEVTHFVAVKEDITDKKQMEVQFLRAQRLEGVGALASGIAHDLNNILSPVLMIAALLRETVSDDESREMLDTIESCAQRGADIIKQLLTFARGKPGARVPLPVRHLLRDLGKIVAETFPRDIQPRIDTPADLWPLIGDATQVHQALMNLCVNARDAMPDGGTLTMGAKNVLVDAAFAMVTLGAKPGPYVCVSVADTGTGIPPEDLDRIFDPFFTTKEIGKGTGLGLATVLGIVRGHDGFVRVDSHVGRGTGFDLYFPASPQARTGAAAAIAPTPPRGQGELILVVDDEVSVRDGLRRTLENHGYRVVMAAHGTEGLAAFSEHRAEVRAVLTDMMMPVMNGPAMINALRELDPGVLILGMSGLAERKGLKGYEHVELPVLLAKPFTGEELLRALHASLQAAPAG